MIINTGSIVRGENYFARQNLIDKVWEVLASGNHILLVAPRRVGKSSLMYYLKDNPRDNFYFLFLENESVNNENEYYRRLLSKLLSSDYLKTKDKILTQIKNSIPAIKKVGTDGVEFDLTNKVDYLSEFTRVINLIDLGENKLIFLLDEFSQTVENIRECEGEKNAIHFLQTNRGLRQTLSDKILFVYSGSIGLECIVESLNAIATINDITPIKIKPFSSIDAKKMITLLLEKLEFTIEDNIIDYMLNEIEWLIPFYIQLTMFALKEIKREEGLTVISESIIDKAFQEMIEQKHYFEHWHTRLKNPKNPELYNYAKELLNIISEFGYIESNEVYNLAVKYNIENEYKNILGTLVYDGYINNDDNLKTYRFNSPILKMWWWKYVAN